LFDSTIEASKILGLDSELAQQLAQMRAKLAPDRIGKHGQLQEWLDDIDQPNNNHRHMSPLWGLFPGAQFTKYSDPKISDGAKLLLKWRGDGSTGWSYAWRIPLWARVGDGEFAYRQLSLQLGKRVLPNLFDLCGPFQADGNFGATAGLAEMLLQSHVRDPKTGVVEIDLLPALPKAWKSGSVTRLRARGGFDIGMSWNESKLTSAIIRSKLGNPCELRCGEAAASFRSTSGPDEVLVLNGKLVKSW
jgi:alpha-L-fucosidase 2